MRKKKPKQLKYGPEKTGSYSIHFQSVEQLYLAFIRKTNDIPEYHREEAEMVIPAYGYFIRGAQTTFSGVLRSDLNTFLCEQP